MLSIAMFLSEKKNNKEAYGKFISDLRSYMTKDVVKNNFYASLSKTVANLMIAMLLRLSKSYLYNKLPFFESDENVSRVYKGGRIKIISHEAVGDFIHQNDSCEIPEEFSNIFEDYKEALLKTLSESERVKFENKKLSKEAINKLVDVLIYIVKDLIFKFIIEENPLRALSQEAKDINVRG